MKKVFRFCSFKQTAGLGFRLLVILCAVLALPANAQQLLNNPGLEGSYTGTATSWRINAWHDANRGESAPQYEIARETRADYVHGGASSQRFKVTSRALRSGCDLIQGYSFVKGRKYRASVWLKADKQILVRFWTRYDAHPYGLFAGKTVNYRHQLAAGNGRRLRYR